MGNELTYQQDCFIQGKGFLGFCGQSWQQTQMFKYAFIGLVILLLGLFGLVIWKKYKDRF